MTLQGYIQMYMYMFMYMYLNMYICTYVHNENIPVVLAALRSYVLAVACAGEVLSILVERHLTV